MEHVEFVYTTGMSEEEIAERLAATHTGVLALADADDAYAVPLSFHFDGERFLIRVGEDENSEKVAFVEAPGEACFVVFDADGGGRQSWSVVARGTIQVVADDAYDDATLNELFPPLHVFDEVPEDVAVHVVALDPRSITGRRTLE